MEKEINYQQLLKISSKLFAEQGVVKTTISQIARVANISSRTVFRYFGTKEDLVVEVIRCGVKGMNLRIDELVSKDSYKNADGMTQMCMLFGLLIDLVVKHSLEFVSVEEVETYLIRHKNPKLIEQYVGIYGRLVKEADSCCRKGLSDGTIHEMYRDEEMFYTLCNNVRGFVYRIIIQTEFADYSAEEMERLKKNHLSLLEKLLLP